MNNPTTDLYYPIELSQDTAERIIAWRILVDALVYLWARSQMDGHDESKAIAMMSLRISQIEASIVPSLSGSLSYLIESGKIPDPLACAERTAA